MPIDPALAAICADPRATVRPPPPHVTLEQIRAASRTGMIDPDPPGGVDVSDALPRGPADPPRHRLYRPAGTLPSDTVVFAHGGGFVVGDLDTHDGLCRRLCLATGMTIASVDYRRAPEARFPAGADDILAVAQHLARGGARSLSFAGDSAGGFLALAACARAAEAGLGPRALALIYPVVDPGCDTESHHALAEGPILTRAAMQWFWAQHLDGGVLDWRPLTADLSALPPVTVITAEYDPLRDEGEALAGHLVRQCVETRCWRVAGAVHGFLSLNPQASVSLRSLDLVARALSDQGLSALK